MLVGRVSKHPPSTVQSSSVVNGNFSFYPNHGVNQKRPTLKVILCSFLLEKDVRKIRVQNIQ
jgi:hypothetical protein